MVNDIRVHMTAESGVASGEIVISSGRLCEAITLVDMIIEASEEGLFNKHFLNARFQFGLVIQFMFALAFQRLKIHGQWRFAKACIQVARRDGVAVGFFLLREGEVQGNEAALELTLLCVVRSARRRGIGAALMSAALNHTPCNQDVRLACLVQNHAMNGLMKKIGARQIKQNTRITSLAPAMRSYAVAGRRSQKAA